MANKFIHDDGGG